MDWLHRHSHISLNKTVLIITTFHLEELLRLCLLADGGMLNETEPPILSECLSFDQFVSK